MEITISLEAIAQFIIVLLGIFALAFLIVVLINLNRLIKTVNKHLDDNSKEIDSVIKDMPAISAKAKTLVSNVDDIVVRSGPEVQQIIGNVKILSDSAGKISEDVTETVSFISESAIDTADNIRYGVHSATDYLSFVYDIIEIVKNLLRK